MIKNYFSFIKESFGGFNTLAEYIESLSKDNDYALSLISEFTKDVNTNVKLVNAISTLDEHTQRLILKMILDEKSNKVDSEAIKVNSYTSTDLRESSQTGGKNIFKCFLKVVSAIGQKDMTIDWEKTPDNFLCIFLSQKLNSSNLKSILSRYVYFDSFTEQFVSDSLDSQLYFGIDVDSKVKYGVINENKMVELGNFILTQGTYNYIMTLDLKSSTNIKKFLVSLDLQKLNTLSKIKKAMKDFFPGQSEHKNNPTISNDVMTYGFQGLGNWDNGQLDLGEIDNLKNNLRGFLIQHKWSDKVQFNIVPSDNWVFINLKIK